MSDEVIAVLGVGPGLGLSVARRFGAGGYAVALVSRNAERHDAYRAGLAGVGTRGYTADLTDAAQLRDVVARIRNDFGRLDVVYFGPAAAGSRGIVPLPDSDADAVQESVEMVLIPAVNLVSAVLPGMLADGGGTLLFAGGLSGLRPMPMLGNLAPASAALRMYVLTLHAALAGQGVYVGALTIGGLVAGGDIHRMVVEQMGGAALPTLDPDEIAAAAWRMAADRVAAESVFDAMSA
jgi:NAD(P)-dependent dehydrogenase (short-subunit alcohol dehydrogenase family)